ncbi:MULTISPECIES: TIM barrel protein [unclassified Shewanella]|uniref:TIM barrel protein n=1 Tax=unclassified Shewanella TaxID=196818 RepID=UPI000C821464|nr:MULTISPECIES: TIM barrel protein [unclassified Shewanella]MDO6620533.1 TIM barrel protein [Shewanella sp. 6_MG-2023]MDO6777206.1 TIM barrel protein [Shewanella sp. 3_MG-2023]PMG30924.1 hypothetical protein BCU94_10110 [Shewanella sp. 10N.286.52.C2]PMG51932.1 hypothetical protein BCU91_15885 [Shewanella sp. 10N.286.52.B9]
MKQLTNLTVTPNPGHLLDNWQQAEDWLSQMNLDGFEIYPHGTVSADAIPAHLSGGFHLQSFPILTPLLYNDSKRLMDIFGDWDTVAQFYGGTDADYLINTLTQQLDLAHALGAPYAVFHPMDCDIDNLISQHFPWTYEDTVKACSLLLNQVLAKSKFKGKLLFENMWWQQSFRLDNRCEYDLLRHSVDYQNCGICFDTGHMMATQTQFSHEQQALDFIEQRLLQLDLHHEICTLHLNSNILPAHKPQWRAPLSVKSPFWQQFDLSLQHINKLDPHQAFSQCDLSNLIERIKPDFLVHEINQKSLPQWQTDISTQMTLLNRCLRVA